MNNKGQTLIEVIIASFVGILVVTALTFATIFSLRNASLSKNSAQATKLAQEGIERVRMGRDRDTQITNNFKLDGEDIPFWNGNSNNVCSMLPDIKSNSIWCHRINTNCGNNTLPVPTHCYFNVNSSGELRHLTAAPSIPSNAEQVGQFQRVVILSDEAATYQTQKIVTVVVSWNDFAGSHESRLTTILRKL